MKALSIHPVFAFDIATGEKTIECRTWKTDYRGEIVICSTAKKLYGTVPGCALAVVTLKDVVPFKREHLQAAMMEPKDYRPGLYAWILENNRIIKPIPVKGKLSLWEFTQLDKIEYIPECEWVDAPEYTETNIDWFEKYWKEYAIL